MLEQLEEVEGVATVRLRLPHDHRPDLAGVAADDQRVAEGIRISQAWASLVKGSVEAPFDAAD